MNFPPELNSIVKMAVSENPKNIDAATTQAVNKWRASPSRNEWLDALEQQAIRSMVHDCRHHATTAIKNAAGEYGGPAKVTANGTASKVAMNCYLSMFIGGKQLGDFYGSELPGLIEKERNQVAGHQFNLSILTRIKAMNIPDNKKIREVLNEKMVAKIVKQVKPEKVKRKLESVAG